MSAKVVLCNSVILDMSGGFSLFRSLSKFNLHKLQCIQNSVARIVSNTSRYTSITPVFKNCIGFLLNIAPSLKQPPLFISFSTLVFPSILLHIYLPTEVPTVPGAVRVLVVSLSFPSFRPQSINLSDSLVIVLLLMLPLFGMLFLMRFVRLPLLPPSENTSKPTPIKKEISPDVRQDSRGQGYSLTSSYSSKPRGTSK